MSSVLHYTGLDLDRAPARRADPAWISAMLARPDAQLMPLWRDHCLLRSGLPVLLAGSGAGSEAGLISEPVFLGLRDGVPVFTADLSAEARDVAIARCEADDTADLRSIVGSVSREEAGLLAYARGILYWHRRQRFCGGCGGLCEARDGGHVRACSDCATLHFPRIEPAIIVLVELPGDPPRCLLGRPQGAAEGRFATLAGFVEVGESLEDAVRREVAEEAGVVVGPVSYRGSQAWPFPAGLMIGFRTEAESPQISADGAELAEARWFTAAEIEGRIAGDSGRPPYRPDSIGQALIREWLADAGEAKPDGS